METNPFDLTPEQKGLLIALADETGKPIPALLAEALEGLQEHVHGDHAPHAGSGHGETPAAVPAPPASAKPFWEIAEELFAAIPDEALARLPTDGAAQHDHYIYGTPKHAL